MSQDFEQARYATHEKLADRLDELGQGQDIKSLESFAKAYLGMYLDLDKSMEPDERVHLLADDAVIDSIWAGFDSVLQTQSLASPEAIGKHFANDQRMPEGYIALAAMDRRIRLFPGELSEMEIDEQILESLICFHYVDRNELQNQWLDYVVQQRAGLFSATMLRFWQSIQGAGVERYPGFRDILYKDEYHQVLQHLVLPTLQTIQRIHKKLLPALLLSAFECVPHAELLSTCEQRLDDVKSMRVAHHVYWLCSAYLLAPEKFEDILHDYVGRTREKAVPMLNYIEHIIRNRQATGLNINADILATLLSMLAPRFRPVRDQFGRLDDNVAKIAWLFDLLARDNSEMARQAVKRLRRIRVMRLHAEFLDQVEASHQKFGQ